MVLIRATSVKFNGSLNLFEVPWSAITYWWKYEFWNDGAHEEVTPQVDEANRHIMMDSGQLWSRSGEDKVDLRLIC